MFEDFFENNAPVDPEQPNEERCEQIRTAVMEQIAQESEDKKMAHKFMRPFLIIAAAVSVSTGCFVTANAATNGALVNTIAKPFTIILNGEKIEAEANVEEIETDSGDKASVMTFALPEGAVEGVDGLSVAVEDGSDLPSEITYYIDSDDAYYYKGDDAAAESSISIIADDSDDISTIKFSAGTDADHYYRSDNADEEADDIPTDINTITMSDDPVAYYCYDGEEVRVRVSADKAGAVDDPVSTIVMDDKSVIYTVYDGEKITQVTAK